VINLTAGEHWTRGKRPGQYICRGDRLIAEPWMAAVEVTNGYLTVTATDEALAQVAPDVVAAGSACVRSSALAGTTIEAAPPADLTAGWPRARATLAAELTVRLATAAGAVAIAAERPSRTSSRETKARSAEIEHAIAYAGLDAVRLALARMTPGGPPPDPEAIASQVLGNSVYAVRYAHAAAAAVLRWAGPDTNPAGPSELALLDALSWLPERVATAARRGRPDVFARYLEDLAAQTIDTVRLGSGLVLAAAASTALAAGLDLLGVQAPDRM
jgi:arginyl-tRNA synthetase